MKNPKIKIQTKILIVFLLFSLFFVSSISIGVNYLINQRFDSYVKSNFDKRAKQLVEQIKAAYFEAGSFKKIDTSKISLGTIGMNIEVRDLKGRRLLTINRHMQGQMSMHSGQMNKMMANVNPAQTTLPLSAKGRKVAVVKVISMMEGGGLWNQQDIDFKDRLNNSIWFIGIILSSFAVFLSIVLARIFTQPIKKLSMATATMGRGDLGARANINRSDEIGVLASTFNEMAASLEHQQKERQNMLQDISHELKTPLAITRNNIEALQDGLIKPTAQNLQSIHDEILRLSRLVDDLSTLALTDSASLKLNKQNVNLLNLLDGVLKKLKSFLETKQIKANLHKQAQDVEINADAEKLKQIFFNLLFNSYKFVEQNGRIDITVNQEGEFANITIKDNGRGMTQKEITHIFDRFYSAKDKGGTGIGLAVVKRLIDAHNGQIKVQSSPGKGTAFTIILPAK